MSFRKITAALPVSEQAWLFERMEAIGIKPDMEGECFGYGHVFRLEAFSGHLDDLYTTIFDMRTITAQKLKDIAVTHDKNIQRAEASVLIEMGKKDSKELSPEEIKYFYTRLKSKLDFSSRDEVMLLKCRGLLEGIDFTHRTFEHADIYLDSSEWEIPQEEKDKLKPTMQDATLASYLIVPKKLDEQGGESLLVELSCVFSLDNMKEFFKSFNELYDLKYQPPENPIQVAFAFNCVDHFISVLYDQQRQVWIYVDAKS